MIRLLLRRRWFDPDRTMGELLRDDGWRIAYTMEPGWDDEDAPRVAPGFYHCVDHSSTKYGKTWALEGVDVTHWETNGIDRSTVLFHRGNKDEDTRGCILLGLERGRLDDEEAVLLSVPAMRLLRETIGDAEFYLTIAGR